MAIREFHLGFERKIGYSFLGLLAGNLAMLAGLLFISLFRDYPFLAKLRPAWYLTPEESLSTFLLFGTFSLFGWIIVGLPVVLLLPAGVASRLHWSLAVLIGAILGVLVLYLELDRGHLDIFNSQDPTFFWRCIIFTSAAAINSAVAFTMYCTLVQWARLTHEIENGAPSGTPQSSSSL